MVDFTNIKYTPPCAKRCLGNCSILMVKCLELRMFGGVARGECAIRVQREYPPGIPPRHP